MQTAEDDRQLEIEKLRNELTAAWETSAMLVKENNRRLASINEVYQRNEKIEKRLAEMAYQLKVRDFEAEELKADLEQRDAKLSDCYAKIAEVDTELADANTELKEAYAEQALMDDRLVARCKEHAKALAEKDAELAHTRNMLVAARKEHAELQSSLADQRRSTHTHPHPHDNHNHRLHISGALPDERVTELENQETTRMQAKHDATSQTVENDTQPVAVAETQFGLAVQSAHDLVAQLRQRLDDTFVQAARRQFDALKDRLQLYLTDYMAEVCTGASGALVRATTLLAAVDILVMDIAKCAQKVQSACGSACTKLPQAVNMHPDQQHILGRSQVMADLDELSDMDTQKILEAFQVMAKRFSGFESSPVQLSYNLPTHVPSVHKTAEKVTVDATQANASAWKHVEEAYGVVGGIADAGKQAAKDSGEAADLELDAVYVDATNTDWCMRTQGNVVPITMDRTAEEIQQITARMQNKNACAVLTPVVDTVLPQRTIEELKQWNVASDSSSLPDKSTLAASSANRASNGMHMVSNTHQSVFNVYVPEATPPMQLNAVPPSVAKVTRKRSLPNNTSVVLDEENKEVGERPVKRQRADNLKIIGRVEPQVDL